MSVENNLVAHGALGTGKKKTKLFTSYLSSKTPQATQLNIM